MTEREEQLIAEANDAIEKHQAVVEADPYRLTYHLMPPVGLLNDPNGFIYWQGTYHLFYQWNPFKTGHGAKFWGHVTSKDLVHWNQEKVALAPSEWYEKNGCYSGSAVDADGKLTLFYTGNVKDEDGNRQTYQCVAESTDGIHFDKQGVVVEKPDGYTPHFRDPKVWKKDDRWYMIIGAQSDDLAGKAVLYESSDLKQWTLRGAVTGAESEQLGQFGYMWECPDLFSLNEKDVLLISPQGLQPEGMLYNNTFQSGYFVGELSDETAKMTHGDFTELDRGFEFYAPQTTVDEQDRRLMFGWMGVPEQDEDQHPTIEHQWIHAMTLPRELTLRGGHLYQTPVEELKQLRQNQVVHQSVIVNNEETQLEGVQGKAIEVEVTIAHHQADVLEINIRDEARIIYNWKEERLTVERKSFVDRRTEARHCHLRELNSFRLYLDTSSLEIFVNDGAEVFTARLFPNLKNEQLSFAAKGEVEVDISKWDVVVEK